MGELVNLKAILKSTIFSVLATIISLLILAMVSYFGNISNQTLSMLIFIISMVCVVAGGFLCSKHAPKNGFIHGGLVGVGYVLLLILCTCIANKGFFFSPHTLSMSIGGIGAGILGGIFGINSKNNNA